MKTFRLAAAVGLLATSFPLFGQLSLVTTRAAFPTTDTVNWAILGAADIHINYPSPITVATVGGSTVTVSHANSSPFLRYDQGNGWGGTFPTGAILLFSGGNFGPVTFNPAQLISGAGFNVQSDAPGPFSFRLDAYRADETLIGSVTRSSSSGGNIAPIFIGFTSLSANVDFFVATLTSSTDLPGQFAINTLALSGPSAQETPGVVPVPEPSFYGVVGALVVFGLVGRERLRRHSEA